MARVKFTAAVDQIVGKLNGSVFGSGRSGAWVRSKGRFKAGTENPVTVNGLRSQLVKARFAFIASAFRTLGLDVIAAWNASVEDWKRTNVFGDTVRPSGFNLFMQLNLNAMNALGTSDITVQFPPTPEEMFFLNTLPMEFTNGDGSSDPTIPNIMTVTFSSVVDFIVLPGYVLLLEATAPRSAGRSFMGRSEYRQIAQVTGVVPAGPYSIDSNYQEVFGFAAPGSLPVGNVVWMRATYVNVVTGQKGIPNVFTATVGSND